MMIVLFSVVQVLFSEAFAQASKAQAQAPSPLASFLPLIVIFFVFYFLVIRPQKKRMQEEQAMLESLGKGDEVYTKSGLMGTIYGLTDKVVTLEVSEGVRLKFLRGQIGGSTQKLFEEKKDKKAPLKPAVLGPKKK